MTEHINTNEQQIPAENTCPACETPAPEAAPVYTAPAPTYAPPAPTYTPPVYTPPVYTPPAYPAPVETVVPTKAKVLGFVGMGLGIGSLVFAIIGILYTLIGFAVDGMGFGMSIGFGMFSMPLSIVGKILVNRSIEAGNKATACSVGSKMSTAGLAVTCVMLALGFTSLIAQIVL